MQVSTADLKQNNFFIYIFVSIFGIIVGNALKLVQTSQCYSSGSSNCATISVDCRRAIYRRYVRMHCCEFPYPYLKSQCGKCIKISTNKTGVDPVVLEIDKSLSVCHNTFLYTNNTQNHHFSSFCLQTTCLIYHTFSNYFRM